MSRKTGIFSRTSSLVGTTLEETESTVTSLLSTISSTVAIMPTMAEEFHNDSKEDLIDSRVRLATKRSEAFDQLTQLKYSKEEIEELLKV